MDSAEPPKTSGLTIPLSPSPLSAIIANTMPPRSALFEQKNVPEGGQKGRADMKFWIAAFLFLVDAHGLAVADGNVRIGVLTDMSGAYSSFSGPGSVTAARMAVADFGGSVLGRPIEVISADHQNKPDNAAAIANAGSISKV
jgi:ABC-type branched-subunit amino acid transport system substrate-binding protein